MLLSRRLDPHPRTPIQHAICVHLLNNVNTPFPSSGILLVSSLYMKHFKNVQTFAGNEYLDRVLTFSS